MPISNISTADFERPSRSVDAVLPAEAKYSPAMQALWDKASAIFSIEKAANSQYMLNKAYNPPADNTASQTKALFSELVKNLQPDFQQNITSTQNGKEFAVLDANNQPILKVKIDSEDYFVSTDFTPEGRPGKTSIHYCHPEPKHRRAKHR